MTRSPKGSAGWVSVQGLGRPLLPVGALAPAGPGGTALEEGQAGLPFLFFFSFPSFSFLFSFLLPWETHPITHVLHLWGRAAHAPS